LYSQDIFPPAPVRQRREQAAEPKEHRASKGERRGPVAVAEVAADGNGQAERDLGADDDDVDLQLRVAQAFLKEVPVERERGDGACA
jgi:hypothetical protein